MMPTAFWLTRRIRSMRKPYSQPLLTSVRLLCSSSLGGGDIIDKNNCIKSIYCFNTSAGGTIGENILWKFFFQQDFFIGAAHFLLNILPKSKRLHSQFFNVVQSKKGSIHELSDAIPLHLQWFQGVHPLECKAVNNFDLVPLQFTTNTKNPFSLTKCFYT